jgi:hypothetical protein
MVRNFLGWKFGEKEVLQTSTQCYEGLQRSALVINPSDRVVLQPRRMSPERLQELCGEARKISYREKPQAYRIFELFKRVIYKEIDGSFKRQRRVQANRKFGRNET